METRKNLLVTGGTAPGKSDLSKPSTCWWYTCVGIPEKSLTNARLVGLLTKNHFCIFTYCGESGDLFIAAFTILHTQIFYDVWN